MKCFNCGENCEVCGDELTSKNCFPEIVQVIPLARVVYAAWVDDNNNIFTHEVDVIVLDNHGQLSYLYSDCSGEFSDPSEVDNFLGYWYKALPLSEAWVVEKIAERNAALERRRKRREKSSATEVK